MVFQVPLHAQSTFNKIKGADRCTLLNSRAKVLPVLAPLRPVYALPGTNSQRGMMASIPASNATHAKFKPRITTAADSPSPATGGGPSIRNVRVKPALPPPPKSCLLKKVDEEGIAPPSRTCCAAWMARIKFCSDPSLSLSFALPFPLGRGGGRNRARVRENVTPHQMKPREKPRETQGWKIDGQTRSCSLFFLGGGDFRQQS